MLEHVICPNLVEAVAHFSASLPDVRMTEPNCLEVGYFLMDRRVQVSLFAVKASRGRELYWRTGFISSIAVPETAETVARDFNSFSLN